MSIAANVKRQSQRGLEMLVSQARHILNMPVEEIGWTTRGYYVDVLSECQKEMRRRAEQPADKGKKQ